MRHVVIIPYFSEPEIDRYLRIAARLREFPKQRVAYEFMLAASPRIEPSERLRAGFAAIAPARHFQCPTKIFGYPQGPTAMFWDCVDHLNDIYQLDGGFGLWLESDMIPVKPDWISRLSDEWQSARKKPLIMGLHVPDVAKKRFFRRSRPWVKEHLNGGACYANDFVRHLPLEAREGVFDVRLWDFLKDSEHVIRTRQIAFSTVADARRDSLHPERVLLHGFLQDKDAFLDACMDVDLSETGSRLDAPAWWDRCDEAYQRFLLRFVIRGRRAMLKATLLEQRRLEREMTAAVNSLRRAA